jgi:hypothetical protein
MSDTVANLIALSGLSVPVLLPTVFAIDGDRAVMSPLSLDVQDRRSVFEHVLNLLCHLIAAPFQEIRRRDDARSGWGSVYVRHHESARSVIAFKSRMA